MKNEKISTGLLWMMIIVVIVLLIPLVINNGYYLRIISLSAISIILALSLNVLYGLAGQISFGHAGFYALGAYTSSILETRFGIGLELSLLLTITICFLLSWAIAFPILKLKHHYLGMATLAFGLLIYTIAMQWLPVTGGPSGMFVPNATLFGFSVANVFYYIIIISTAIAFLLCTSIYHSKVGLALKAIAEDEGAAKAAGIDVVRYKTLVFSFSGTLAAFAGILYAHLSSFISPEAFSLHTSIMILTMVVIGGLGSNGGAVIGALFLTLLPEFIESLEDMKTLFYGVVLLIVLLFLPNGLISIFSKTKAFALYKKMKNKPERIW